MKRGVRQAISKRKLRRTGLVDITRDVFFLAFVRWMLRVRHRASGVQRVVVQRLLPGITRPAERQAPCWSGGAEKHVCDGIAGLHSRKPRGNDGGHVSEGPWKRQRPSAEQN